MILLNNKIMQYSIPPASFPNATFVNRMVADNGFDTR